MRFFALVFILILSRALSAQSCEKVLVTGKVIDTLRPQNFYNLMIVNRSNGRGVFGQPNGTFSVYVSNGDTLIISVKEYTPVRLVVQADSNCQFLKRIFIEGRPQEIQEITVTPLKSLEQIKEEREALAMRETRMVTGIEMLESPITALYQAFSKVERNKRWIAEQEYKDNQRKVVRELLRVYVAFEIIELSEEEFDAFVDFLNINEDFLKTATEMELITFIKDKFEHFNIVNKLRMDKAPEWRKWLRTDYNRAVQELMEFNLSNKIIDLPESEHDRFIVFLGLNRELLMEFTDEELMSLIRIKYNAYLAFYKIDIRLLNANFNIEEADNEDWRWILERRKDKKAATIALLDLYNERRVIQLSKEEYEKFIIFMNLKESFMKSAKNEQLITFVRAKFYDYLEFYRN
ncbi:MAG: hypothetical protein ACK45H_13005 [Bacteroidota bacterium]|jgi:hypothetical protein